MRIVLTGGGTGGHLFPVIAVAHEIKNIFSQNASSIPASEKTELKLMFLGPPTIGEDELTQEGITHIKILAGKMRRYASAQNIFDAIKIPFGVLQSLWQLFVFMPNVIFSKGGYGSIPVVFAAWLLRLPILIHESDAVPGLANKFAAKFSRRIAISYLDTAQYFPEQKIALTGNPIRPGIFGGSKDQAQKIFGLSGTKPVLLILGGSQGAQQINDTVFASLPHLIARCEIIHQCGQANYEELKQQIKLENQNSYFLYPFLNEEQIRHAFAAADLVISRAGAGTVAEIATLGKPSILVPLPNSAADHQLKNALEYAKFGATLVMEQMNLTPHLLQNQVFSLLDNPELLRKMSGNALKFNPPDAAQKIAQEVLNIAKW